MKPLTFLRALLATFVLTVGILPGCSSEKRVVPDNSPIVIGAVLPMTGDAGTFGQNAYRGAKIAVDEENSKGGINNRKFALQVEDSRGTAENAAAAGRKLIDIDKATLLVGDVTSAGTHALTPIITQAKIPLISPAASDPALSGASDYFARVWPSDVYEAEVIGGYAQKKGFHNIAVVYANTDYGLAMQKQFVAAMPKEVIKLIIPVEREASDYRPTVQRIAASGADALFVVLYPEDAKRFLQQSARLRLALPILATATIEDPTLVSAPGIERLVFASPVPPDDNDATRKSFVTQYRKTFNADPGVVSDTAYDSVKLLVDAARSEGLRDSARLMNHIKSLKEYKGASGVLTFSQNGDVRKPYRLRTVKDGKFTWL